MLTEYSEEVGTKIRVDNVHYDLTKEDLEVRTTYSFHQLMFRNAHTNTCYRACSTVSALC